MHLRSSDEDSSSQDSDLLSVAGAMGEEESPSMEAVQADQPLPKRSPILGDSSLQFPFPELHGEVTVYVGRAENALIALSSYRLHIQFRESTVNVPLRLIDGVECRDVFQLHITCKDCKVIRCQFSSLEQCHEWLKRLASAVRPPSRLEELFCFAFHAWCLDVQAGEKGQSGELCGPGGHVTSRFWKEVERMGFDTKGAWRVTEINRKYRLCPSYPQLLVVPAHISDTELESVATFRSWKRFPAVVYRHCSTGAVIARCGQPEVSWWGWRNADDERLAQSIVEACALDRSSQEHLVNGSCNRDSSMSSASECVASQPPKLLILDARSYAAAVANRAKGGGCECPEYYSSCEVVFMGMANIHAIRRSFASLRLLCTQMPDPANWLSALEGTKWLQHLSVLLKAALLVVNAVDRDHRPVTVHCSDGWDRTPQIVALSKVLLDPYYRTIEGFQILVEMEWLDFGHKFADRCGHGPNSEDPNERCPVFLQWLDCVHQLLRQFPCSFQFNETFLVKLAQHTYSCLFGTFLCNSRHEREEHRIQERTCSVWSLLRPTNPAFLNVLYSTHSETVLLPVFHVRSLLLWSAVYLPSSSRKAPSDEACAASPEDGHLGRLPKMRSFDGLAGTCEAGVTSAQTRRSSDPSLQERQDHRRALEISVGVVKKGGGTLVWEGTATHSHGVELKMCQSEVQDGHLIEELSNAEEDKNGSIGGRTKWSGYNHNGEIELLMEVGVAKEQMEHFLQEASEDDDGRAGKIGGDTDVGHADHVSAPNSELLPDLSAEGVEELRDQLSNKLAMDLLEESVSQQTLGEPFRSNTSLMVNSPESEIEMDGPIEAPSDDPGVSDLCPVTPAEEPGDLASFSMISKKLVIQEAPDGPSVRALFSEAGDEDPRVAPPAVHSLDVGEPHSDAVQQQVMEEGYQLKAQALRTQMPVPDPESHFQPSCRLRCSTELLSEASWEKMGPQDTEATPWYPESSATPCYGCESRFWLTGRKHHCRAARPAEEAWNCGNVFCASCCAHKVSVQSQHLTEPSRVCGTCYGSLRLSTVPVVDLELEKPIAASSN